MEVSYNMIVRHGREESAAYDLLSALRQ